MSVQGDIQSVTADLNLCMWSQRWLGERDLAWGPAHLPTNGTRLRREERAEVSSAWPQVWPVGHSPARLFDTNHRLNNGNRWTLLKNKTFSFVSRK